MERGACNCAPAEERPDWGTRLWTSCVDWAGTIGAGSPTRKPSSVPKPRLGHNWHRVESSSVRSSDHVGNDLLGLSSLNTHVFAQKLPYEHVGNCDHADQPVLSTFPSQAMEQRFKGPFGPPPVVVATNVHQKSNGRQSILLRQHPKDGETVCFIVCKENLDCPGNIPHSNSVTSSNLLFSPPLIRFGEEVIFAAKSLVEGLYGDSSITGDVLQTHLFVGSRAELLPCRCKQSLASCRGCVGSCRHSIGTRVGFLGRQFGGPSS